MSTLLQPLADRVLVRAEVARETASCLLIPQTAQDKPQRGTVIAAGDGPRGRHGRRPLEVSEGDEILFSKYGATEIHLDGEELLMLKYDDVVAVVES